MDYNAGSIIDAIKKNNLQKAFFHSDDRGYMYEIIAESVDQLQDTEGEEPIIDYLGSLGLKNFKNIEVVSNTDDFYSIVYFEDENVYLRFSGTYDSYGQYEHYYNNEVKQVFPKQVTITKFE